MDWANPFLVLNLIWNLAIDIIILYTLINYPIFQSEIASCKNVKPLFVYFAKLSLDYIHPICFSITIIYYFVFSQRLLRLLDSPCFMIIYNTKRQAIFILTGVIVSTHIIYIILLANQLQYVSTLTFDLRIFLSQFSAYIINIFQFSVCIILHYYQFATFKLLDNIYSKLSHKVLFIEEGEALKDVIELAILNHKLNHTMSIPIIAYGLMNAVHMTTAICFSMICAPNWSMISSSLSVWAYLIYIAWLNQQIKQLVKLILSKLRRNYQLNVDRKEYTQLFEMSAKYNSEMIRSSKTQHRALKIQQADLYEKYFSMRIFYFTLMGFPFFLKVALLIADYVLLLSSFMTS